MPPSCGSVGRKSARPMPRHLLLPRRTAALRGRPPRRPSPPAPVPRGDRARDRGRRATGRVYVASSALVGRARLRRRADSSQIWLAYSDNEGFSWTTRRASPLAGTATIAVPRSTCLPDGRVVVAFRNDATPSPQIETETCVSPTPRGQHPLCGGGASAVGPSTVVGDASAPGLVSGLVGPPTPSVVAAGGRVTVAWHASAANGVRAVAAMSTDGGATFGPAQQIDPFGPGNQVAPQLAATAGGRVDAAYLWDSGGGVQATVVSAGPRSRARPPRPGHSPSSCRQPPPARRRRPSPARRRRSARLGLATAAVHRRARRPRAWSRSPARRRVRTCASSGSCTGRRSDDRRSTVKASKNTTTSVHVDGRDEDGDPLTWSTGAQPSATASRVTSRIPRAATSRSAPPTSRAPTPSRRSRTTACRVTRRGDDHRQHRQRPARRSIARRSYAREDTPPRTCDVLACVSDPNQDPLTVDLDGAQGGKVERVAGTWRFVPASQSIAPGSFLLHVRDNDPDTPAVTARMTVVISKAIGKVSSTWTVPSAAWSPGACR